MKSWLTPPPLRRGDRIALITPATVVKEEFTAPAEEVIRNHGFVPVRMPGFTTGSDGRFAGNANIRLKDLQTALSDPEIKAVFCGRGGYGSVQLISRIALSLPAMNPKWLIGFSDICALHALMLRCGIKSLHAPMLKRLAARTSDEITEAIFHLLSGGKSAEFAGNIHPLQQCGVAEGILVGGNVSVLGDLAGTPFDPYSIVGDTPFILLIEDVGESLSRLQRRLWRMRLAGIFNRAAAIVVGQFTACQPGINFTTAEDMIADLLREWNVTCPVAYDFPIGHDDYNVPVVIGGRARLEVYPTHTLLTSYTE